MLPYMLELVRLLIGQLGADGVRQVVDEPRHAEEAPKHHDDADGNTLRPRPLHRGQRAVPRGCHAYLKMIRHVDLVWTEDEGGRGVRDAARLRPTIRKFVLYRLYCSLE